MLTPQVSLTSNLDWGLGWALETTNHGSYFWHWGDGGIFKSFTLASREHQNGIVILTNSQNGLKICEQILQWTMVGGHPAFGLEMINY